MIDIEDIDSFLESQENMVRAQRPGTEKKVLWSQGKGVKLLVHGTS